MYLFTYQQVCILQRFPDLSEYLKTAPSTRLAMQRSVPACKPQRAQAWLLYVSLTAGGSTPKGPLPELHAPHSTYPNMLSYATSWSAGRWNLCKLLPQQLGTVPIQMHTTCRPAHLTAHSDQTKSLGVLEPKFGQCFGSQEAAPGRARDNARRCRKKDQAA